MKRIPVLVLAIVLVIVSAGNSQEAESTRFVRISGDHRETLARFLGAVRPEDMSDELDRVLKVIQELRPGDRATFQILAEAGGELEHLELDVHKGIRAFARFRGSEAPFRAVRDSMEAYWRRSLGAFEDTVKLAVRERVWPREEPPAAELAYRTVREFSCDGYGIEAELSRDGDTLELDLLGISPPRGLCGQVISSAHGSTELDVPAGTYTLAVRNRGREDRYELTVTDSALRLRSVRAAFTAADSRIVHRRPPNSFALYCGTTEGRAPLCGRLRSWIASGEGVTVHRFPEEGVVPFRRGIGTHYGEQSHFRYEDPAALEPVRACFERLEELLAGLKGMSMTAELWTGALLKAWPDPDRSRGDGSATDPAARGSDLGPDPCLPSVPPPSVDPPDAGGPLGGPFALATRDAQPCLTRRELEARRDSVRAERSGRSPPVRMPRNSSRHSASRQRFHFELREWDCRGGSTVGDAEEDPGEAWFWVEEGGDWYFLSAGTTAEGVGGYLDLLEENGGELAWTPLDHPGGGSERVALGPGKTVIPGFRFYRWRP